MPEAFERNYLREVVAKIDFQPPLKAIAQSLPADVHTALIARFPVEEVRDSHSGEFLISVEKSASAVEPRFEDYKTWVFHAEDRSMSVFLDRDALMLSCTNYSRFDPFYDALIQTVEAIRLLSPIEVSRIGLRYINQITVEEASPLDWARYICSDLLAGIRFAPNKSALSRAMGLLEFNFGDSFMRLQYGMPNPDFPAAIRQKLFVLDYDHYTTGVMSLSDATNHVEVFNKMIYAHFDASITDELKALMRIAVES